MTAAALTPALTPALTHVLNGAPYDPANPLARPIHFGFIGNKLARIVRFGAHPGALSVLQHQVMGAEAMVHEGASPWDAALFLHHDDHEFILGDETTPTTEAKARVIPGYRAGLDLLKANWDAAIYGALGLPAPDVWTASQRQAVERMDARMMLAEGRALFGATFRPDITARSPLSKPPRFTDRDQRARGGPLGCLWPPELAVERWMQAHKRFTERTMP